MAAASRTSPGHGGASLGHGRIPRRPSHGRLPWRPSHGRRLPRPPPMVPLPWRWPTEGRGPASPSSVGAGSAPWLLRAGLAAAGPSLPCLLASSSAGPPARRRPVCACHLPGRPAGRHAPLTGAHKATAGLPPQSRGGGVTGQRRRRAQWSWSARAGHDGGCAHSGRHTCRYAARAGAGGGRSSTGGGVSGGERDGSARRIWGCPVPRRCPDDAVEVDSVELRPVSSKSSPCVLPLLLLRRRDPDTSHPRRAGGRAEAGAPHLLLPPHRCSWARRPSSSAAAKREHGGGCREQGWSERRQAPRRSVPDLRTSALSSRTGGRLLF